MAGSIGDGACGLLAQAATRAATAAMRDRRTKRRDSFIEHSGTGRCRSDDQRPGKPGRKIKGYLPCLWALRREQENTIVRPLRLVDVT
ncbi:hypothetical protein GCM10028812_32860 [Ancylobacter sonchi]